MALCWMEEQFAALEQGEEAGGGRCILLSAKQGITVLAHTFQDARRIEMEAERLKKWIRSSG